MFRVSVLGPAVVGPLMETGGGEVVCQAVMSEWTMCVSGMPVPQDTKCPLTSLSQSPSPSLAG